MLRPQLKLASADFSAEKVDEKLPPIEVKKEPIAQKVIQACRQRSGSGQRG